MIEGSGFWWEDFAAHVARCGKCQQFGGLAAPKSEMCNRGRAIVEAWENAFIDLLVARRHAVGITVERGQ